MLRQLISAALNRDVAEDDPAAPELILTEPGLGYRLRELDSRVERLDRSRS